MAIPQVLTKCRGANQYTLLTSFEFCPPTHFITVYLSISKRVAQKTLNIIIYRYSTKQLELNT